MNPDTNRFEALTELAEPTPVAKLLRPNGEPVPAHWTVLALGEQVVVKGYTFKVAYINETTLVLEPVKIPILGPPR